VQDLTDTVGIVALAAGGVALIALATSITLAVRMRRLRADQKLVLGGGAPEDVIAHAAGLERDFVALNDQVSDIVSALGQRMDVAERRLDGAISYRALVRYDAYGEMSGHQSTSIALLDASRNGVVLTSIHHRDQARLYAKQVRDGVGELELAPEEAEAVRLALEAGPVPQAGPAPEAAPAPARTE
jgi:Protein of unknown function (DUF4446)